jgi:23S rRNA (uracil1939-C5)-methyltransferase
VLGDARYGAPASNRHFEHKHGLDRSFLHLMRVELQLAGRADPLVLEAPLAGDLASVLNRLSSEPS